MKKSLFLGVLMVLTVTCVAPAVGSCEVYKSVVDKVPIVLSDGHVVQYVDVGIKVESVNLPDGTPSGVIKTTESMVLKWDKDTNLPVIEKIITYSIKKDAPFVDKGMLKSSTVSIVKISEIKE